MHVVKNIRQRQETKKMVRHYCNHSKEMFLCCAESRGDNIDCDNCPCNEDLDSSKIGKVTK